MSKDSTTGKIRLTDAHEPTSRRDAIKWGLAALAGAGISALAPASAYAGTGAMQYGTTNDAGTDGTVLTSSNSLGFTFLGDPETGATLALENTYVTGTGLLRFWGHALHAKAVSDGETAIVQNTGAGTAVYATSTSGYGVVAKGGKANLQLSPAATAGAPSAGTHSLGEVFADKDGVVWLCTTAGTPGTWNRLVHDGTNAADVGVAALTASGAATLNGGATVNGALTAGGALTASGAAALNAGATVNGTLAASGAVSVGGPLSMTRSGRTRVKKGSSSVSVKVASGVATTSNIICTLQNSAGAGAYIRYAKRTSSTTFKIYLNKKATTKTAYVAWMILG